MSRLDSFIRRLEAQRACLGLAVELIAGVPGPAFELGLGNGRTFDHLREILPEREIFVFERQLAAHPLSMPDEDHMILGNIETTLPASTDRFRAKVALAHSDVGTGDPASNAAIARFLGTALVPLMATGGVVVADRPLPFPDWDEVPLPAEIRPGRYFMYRAP